jgi:hypothetical protein
VTTPVEADGLRCLALTESVSSGSIANALLNSGQCRLCKLSTTGMPRVSLLLCTINGIAARESNGRQGHCRMKARFRTRVLIATTEGPVEVESLIAEDAVLARSVICVGGSTETAGIDREYHAFVDRGTGLIARLYGHDRFRLDVSGRVDAGSSWQLGVFIAHALHATGRLAHKGEEAGTVVLATGRVQPLDEAVLEVGHVDHKLRRALERLQADAANKSDIFVAWPKANGSDVGEESRAELRNLGAKVIEIDSLVALREALGLQNGVPNPSKNEIVSLAPAPGGSVVRDQNPDLSNKGAAQAPAQLGRPAALPWPSYILSFFVAPIVLLVLAHYLIIMAFDLNTLVLRLATVAIPLVLGFLLYRRTGLGPVVALLLGVGIGTISVFGMMTSVALVDGAPIVPSMRRDWQEAIEYLVSIVLAAAGGNLLARSITARGAL